MKLTFRRRAIALALPVLFPFLAQAGESSVASESFGIRGQSEKITMAEAIRWALENNLEARFERVGISIAQSRVRFAAGAFDPVFTIDTSQQSLRRLENAGDLRTSQAIQQDRAIRAQEEANDIARAIAGLPPLSRESSTVGLSSVTFDAQTNSGSGGLQGRTPWGMRYGFQLELNRTRNTFTGDTRDVIPEYQTFVGLTVRQPLLRNLGPGANLADLRIARMQRRIQQLEWQQTVSATVQSVMSTYYDMLFGVADVQVRTDAIAADEKLVVQNQRRMELGFMSPFDVQQARAQVSLDQEQLLSSKNLFNERQFALKRLILGELNVNDSRDFYPVDLPPLAVPALNRSAFLAQAFAHRYDFHQALAEADAQDIRLRFARNQLLPQLDLVATYGLNGLGDDIGDTFTQAFQGRTPTWALGLSVQIPLANLQARARLAEARGLKEQAILRIKQTELTIGVDVDTVLSRIETNRQRVDTARNTRELNEEAVRIALRRLEEGQISSFDVIEQQRRLYDARSREFQSRAELNKSITQLWLVTGTVVERSGIRFAPATR